MAQPRDKKKQVIKKALLDALNKTLGNVSEACAAVGISRKTFYEYLKQDDDFANDVQSVEETAIDFAESKLRQLIDGVTMLDDSGNGQTIYKTAPNVTATIFFLKTKGKKRGYVEKTEQDVNIQKVEVEFV